MFLKNIFFSFHYQKSAWAPLRSSEFQLCASGAWAYGDSDVQLGGQPLTDHHTGGQPVRTLVLTKCLEAC